MKVPNGTTHALPKHSCHVSFFWCQGTKYLGFWHSAGGGKRSTFSAFLKLRHQFVHLHIGILDISGTWKHMHLSILILRKVIESKMKNVCRLLQPRISHKLRLSSASNPRVHRRTAMQAMMFPFVLWRLTWKVMKTAMSAIFQTLTSKQRAFTSSLPWLLHCCGVLDLRLAHVRTCWGLSAETLGPPASTYEALGKGKAIRWWWCCSQRLHAIIIYDFWLFTFWTSPFSMTLTYSMTASKGLVASGWLKPWSKLCATMASHASTVEFFIHSPGTCKPKPWLRDLNLSIEFLKSEKCFVHSKYAFISSMFIELISRSMWSKALDSLDSLRLPSGWIYITTEFIKVDGFIWWQNRHAQCPALKDTEPWTTLGILRLSHDSWARKAAASEHVGITCCFNVWLHLTASISCN